MTKEEAIKIIEYTFLNADGHLKPLDFDYGGGKGIVEALRMAIEALSKPSLPSNMDEAAEETAKKYYCSCLEKYNETGICDGCENVKLAFKAGAEWMAEQGETVEGDVEGDWRNQEDAPYEIYVTSDCLRQGTKFKFGDKVVVQIRKN